MTACEAQATGAAVVPRILNLVPWNAQMAPLPDPNDNVDTVSNGSSQRCRNIGALPGERVAAVAHRGPEWPVGRDTGRTPP